jgi:ElaB/YqjD/DUF883 family membrane-anchored ribosome-binding protein
METPMDASVPRDNSPADKVKDDLRTLAHDAEDLIKATAGDMSEKAKQARSRLSEAIAQAKVSCSRLQEKSVAAAKVTDEVIRGHPYESIGIAFIVGLLSGMLITRR